MQDFLDLRELTAKFLESIGDNYKFDVSMFEESRILFDEICDYAENTEFFKKYSEGAKNLDDMTAYETYLHMLYKIHEAPFIFFAEGVIILLFPIIRRKMISEGTYR